MNVFVIIVTYNGLKWIDRCLQSISLSSIPVKTIVIDNSSTDNTVKHIKENYSWVILVESKENLGFGKGNNIGLKTAINNNAEYVFLLNQDASVNPDTIEKLINVHKNNPGYGVISPMHMNGAGDQLHYNFATYINHSDCPDLISDIYLNKQKEVYNVEFVNAAAWLLSKECIFKVGGFDPLFSHYVEDIDYIYRVKKYKLGVGVAPGSVIFHDNKGLIWNKIKYDYNKRTVNELMKIKNVSYSFSSNLLAYLKNSLDTMSSDLLFRRFKDLRINIRLFLYVLRNLKRIYFARRQSLLPKAFL